MPIVQKTLDLPLLTQPQIRVIRDIYRMSQINEAKVALTTLWHGRTNKYVETRNIRGHDLTFTRIEQYLDRQITEILVKIRIPEDPKAIDKGQSVVQPEQAVKQSPLQG